MTTFVTGSTGFLGTNLVNRLIRDEKEVVTFNRLPVLFAPYKTQHYCCDLSKRKTDSVDSKLFIKACEDHKPDVIFHLAGNPLSKLDENNPHDIIMDNIVSTQKVLHYAPKGCRVVLGTGFMKNGKVLRITNWIKQIQLLFTG